MRDSWLSVCGGQLELSVSEACCRVTNGGGGLKLCHDHGSRMCIYITTSQRKNAKTWPEAGGTRPLWKILKILETPLQYCSTALAVMVMVFTDDGEAVLKGCEPAAACPAPP